MSKEKQIEEMRKDLCDSIMCDLETYNNCRMPQGNCSRCKRVAEDLYVAGYQKQEWISVDERLPEKSGWYLVNIISPFDFEFVSTSHYSKGYGWKNPDIITHWMPLPEAPKMKGGAE